MSLYEPADGLLETHVTWQDVESEMQKALGTTAKFGANKKATNISDMKGFMSRIALINPDWEDSNGNENLNVQNLPERFAVKISSQLAFLQVSKMLGFDENKVVDLGVMTRECHNREVEAYKFLTKMANPKIPFTKMYAYRSFSEENPLKGFIISEFMPNVAHIGMHENVSAQDLPPFVKALGALSASAETRPEEELNFVMKTGVLEMLFADLFNGEQLSRMFTQLRSAYPEEHQKKVDKYEEIVRNIYSNPTIVKKYTSISKYLGARDVICHCDPWISNFLTTKQNDRVYLKAVIDWQSVSLCNPALDICRHLIACLSAKDLVANKDEFLEIYYNAMLEELGENATPPYTLEQLHQSYHLHLPSISLIVIPGIAPFLEVADIPEDQRETVRQTATEKLIGLLDEVLKSHEYNMEHFGGFFEL